MGSYLLKRVIYILPSLFGILLICFFLTRLSGDPTALMLPIEATEEARQIFRTAYNLDQPIWVQFTTYVSSLIQGDFGNSIRLRIPAEDLLFERLGATVELAAATLAISLLLGLPAGIAAAYMRGSPADLGVRGLSAVFQAIPTFYLGVVCILIFSVYLGWLPTSGRGGILHLLMPAGTLAMTMIALIARVTRGVMLDVLRQDYIRTARAKGMTEHVVLWRHALRNAMIPIVTVVALQIGTLMGGVIVTETVFAWPGIGRLAVQAIYGRDYPVVQVVVLFFAVVFIFVNLVADIISSLLDPRIRY